MKGGQGIIQSISSNAPLIIISIVYFLIVIYVINRTISGTRYVDTSFFYKLGYILVFALPVIALLFAIRMGKINLEGANNYITSLLMFVVLVAGIYVIIYAMGNFSSVISAASTILTALIVIGALAIINELWKMMPGLPQGNRRHVNWVTFLWEFVFYIPCLFTDIIKYIQNQLEITTDAVWTLFVVEIIFLLCYFYFPTFATKLIIHDGNQLVNEPLYLNEKLNLGSIQQIMPKTSIISTPLSAANTDFTLNTNVSDKCDTTTFTANLPKARGKATDVYGNVVDVSCAVLYDTYGGGYQIITGCSFETCDPTYISMTTSAGGGSSYVANYSVAFWVFINPQSSSYYSYTYPTNIFRIGKYHFDNAQNRQQGIPMVTYFNDVDTQNRGDKGEHRYIPKYRIFLTNNGTHYRDVSVPDSKWNLFVINYSGTTVDVFVNGDLVITEKIDAPPSYDDSLSFIVGEDGGLDGAICNLVFFPHILTQQEIYNYYYTLYWKNPPVISITK